MRYNSLNSYLKEKFGCKIYKLALSGGLSCLIVTEPLVQEAVFFAVMVVQEILLQTRCCLLLSRLKVLRTEFQPKIKNGKYIAYFQSFTNTYGDIDYLRSIFTEAINHPDIVALSIGTRPDCLPDEVLNLLGELNKIKPVWVELGLQTIHENTAKYINRGYTLDVFNTAVNNLNKINVDVIVHLIIGLPFESKEDILESVKYVSSMNISGIKLQLLHVLKNTPLEKEYSLNKFEVLSMEEYVDIIAECLRYIPKSIVIHRLTGDGPKSILVAPLWSGNKKAVLNYMNKRFNELNVIQGSLCS